MKPSTRPLALPPPNRLTMYRAIRRCAPESAMAVDSMKPPISSSINGLPNDCPTWAGVRTPNSGNTASGISEVNGIGTGSKIHQVAQSNVTAAVMEAAPVQPWSRNRKYTSNAAAGPMMISQRFIGGDHTPSISRCGTAASWGSISDPLKSQYKQGGCNAPENSLHSTE